MISPEPKTIAFGGVATGIMKAQLAASVAGTIRSSGSTLIAAAVAPRIGRKVAVVAVLLVTSVSMISRAAAPMTRTSTGMPSSTSRRLPMKRSTPVLTTAAARLSPPPNRSRIPHGASSAFFQLSRNTPRRKWTGTVNSNRPAPIAMPGSVSPASGAAPPISIPASQVREVHSAAAETKIASTAFSGAVIGPSFRSSPRMSSAPPGTSVICKR